MNVLKASLKLMRPTQWIKNGFVFMPLVFSGRLLAAGDDAKVMSMFVAFCLASSATYILNDYMDLEKDRVHPTKRMRPLASGEISPLAAMILMGLLLGLLVILVLVTEIPATGFAVLGAYLVLHVFYSLKLKDVVILDVLAIAAGFLLRVLGGAAVISVGVSSWLVLCTFSISLLLALGKRRHEAVILCDDAVCHRPVLENYNVTLLDQLLQVSTTSTFIFYCLYSVRGYHETLLSEKMMFTIPMVTYGIFRYLYLIYQKEDGGSPTAMLLTDPPLLICTIVWLTACAFIIYS
jgi:4-hydroxybenzoate polyprenyltransferase